MQPTEARSEAETKGSLASLLRITVATAHYQCDHPIHTPMESGTAKPAPHLARPAKMRHICNAFAACAPLRS